MNTNLRLFTRFSTRKFYEIISQKQNSIEAIPEIPQNAILSKYLSTKESAKKSQKSIGYKKWERQVQTKLNYNQLLNGNPHGSILTFMHRNQQITLLSTNYFRIEEKKLHKVFYSAKPDAIVVQRRPEYHLHNFNLFPKGSDGIFSDSQYLKQLQFNSTHLQPTQKTMRPILNALNQANDEKLEPNPSKEVLQEKGLQICSKYSSAYKIPMFFGEMPMRTYRQWIANNHTLMELQQIFKVVCQRLPRYRSLSFTPYQMATLIHPEIFLKINDHYMATVIEMLISTKKYKRIFGMFGIIENEAVKHMLQRNLALNPIIEYLVPPGPKGSIIRDIENLEIIQKQILLDILFFGKEASEMKTKLLHTTNAVIAMYGKDIEKKTLMQFRYDKTVQYIKLMQQKCREGEEEIKKQFVRETIRGKH